MDIKNIKKANVRSERYNEKERNIKNIVSNSRQVFDPCQNFINPRHPRTHATYATHAI